MFSSVKQFVLPDLLTPCTLQDSTNPHYLEAAAESRAWINGYNVFTDRKRAYFIQGSNELLVSHTYPYAGYEEFRTCCDFVNLLFVVDEISDDQSGKDAHTTGSIFLNAMRDSEWDDHSILAKMTKEFRARFVRRAGPNTTRRFLQYCDGYTSAVAREAELRERNEVLDTESYTLLRRENSAIRLCLGLIEYVLGIDLPEEVYEDAAFLRVYYAVVDLVCWANDVYSYDMEQAKGHHGNNIVTVLMRQKHISLQEASDNVGTYSRELMERYMMAKESLPSWGPSIDSDVARFIDAAGHWVIGNLEWSFETQRYFGSQHLQIKRTRTVNLRPRGPPEEADSESDSE